MGGSPVTAQALRQEGYDAVHLIEERLERLPDPAILAKAQQEGRILLTFDLGFGELRAAGSEALPSVITFRLQRTTPTFVTARLLEVLAECSLELEAGAIITVRDARYRLRRLPMQRLDAESEGQV